MKKSFYPYLFVFAAVSLTAISSCKKSDEFVNPVYVCECGNLEWNEKTFQLLNANFVVADTANMLSRQYYITASVALEDELQAHNVNVTLMVDSVDQFVFFVEEAEPEELSIVVEEVNFNDPILPVRMFIPTGGVVEIEPAFLGGTETVSFELIMKEYYEGQLVGFPFAFSGTFDVEIE